MLRGSIRCSRSRMSSSGSHTSQAPSRATRRTSWAFAALPAHHQPSACCTQTGYDDGRSSVARTAWHTSLRPRAMDEVAAEAMVLTRQGYAAAALAMTVATQPDWARALGTAQHGQTAEAATAAAEEDSVLRGSIRCSRSRMSSSGSHTSQAPSRATRRTSWAFAALPAHHQPSACCHQTGYDGRSSVDRTPWHTSLRPRVAEAMVAAARASEGTAAARD